MTTPSDEPRPSTPGLPQFGSQGRPRQKANNSKRNLIIAGSAAVVVIAVLGGLAVLGVGKDDDPTSVPSEFRARMDSTAVNGDGSMVVVREGVDGTTVTVPGPRTAAKPSRY